MEFIDIGLNLTHDSFDIDREQVLERALARGVSQMIVTGATVEGSSKAIELAAASPSRLFATAGVHPHHATDLDDQALIALERLCQHAEVVACGECGLDYFRDYSPRDVQRSAFAMQLQLAGRCGKPLFLHQREAHDDFVGVLRESGAAALQGVAHCFTGDLVEVRAYLDLGLHIGITGWICDERRGTHLHDVVRLVPADRLLLETDAPYLLPRDLVPRPKSRRNEPMFLPHVAATVAAARGESLEQLAAQSTAAARKLFGLPQLAS
ncbi:MAG: TatD family hydrolase [Steroidobacteraceae bacterium]